MKKSLLSLLAVAVATVGCQNYDDQFDDLNSQIAALSSQVAGLAQVQSDLSNLAATVTSLQSTVASTATAIEGLDGLSDTVSEISEAVENVASSEDVDAISTDLAQAQSDLTELLDASSVFTDNVVVNSVATLDVYHKMGASLNVVAGNVNITAKPDMDATKLQELVDNIFTTTGDFTYKADQATVAPVTFNNLTGTQSLTVDQAGDYLFQTLASATRIELGDTYKSKVTKIDFRELTAVTQFFTGSVTNTIKFTKATELHLTKLVFYPPNELTIEVDEGAAMPFVMDDVDISGDQQDITLDITGPASFSVTNLEDGSLTFKDVKTVSVDGFEGAFTIKEGVESFSANEVVTLTLTDPRDLETLDITGAKDAAVAKSVGPALNMTSLSSLETVDVDGFLSSFTSKSNGNVTAITIAADVAGKINIDGNDDLTTVTLTGAKATNLTVNNNSDLEALTVDLTFRKGTASTAKLDGALVVTSNNSLASLTSSADNIETLTVTGNTDLAKIDFTGLKKAGATNKASVNIWNNDLSGTLKDTTDSATTKINAGEANDLGSISNDSGLKTLKDYITAADATAKRMLIVYDAVTFTPEGGGSTVETNYVAGTAAESQSNNLKVMDLKAGTGGGSATKAKYSWVIPSVSGSTFDVQTGSTASFTLFAINSAPTSITLSGLPLADVNNITTTENKGRATAAGLTLTAQHGGVSASTVSLTWHPSGGSTSTIIGERHGTVESRTAAVSATNHGFGADDVITFKVGANTVTTTVVGGVDSTTTGLTSATAAVAAAYAAKYGSTGTASKSAVASVTYSNGVLNVAGLDPGSRGHNLKVVFSVAAGTATSTNAKALDWFIGATYGSGDNATTSNNIILTLEAVNPGTSGVVTPVAVNLSTGTVTELTTTQLTVGTDPNKNTYEAQQESRNDVRIAEDTATVTGGATFSRLGWL